MKIIFLVLVHWAPTYEVVLSIKLSGKFNGVKQFRSAIAQIFTLFVFAFEKVVSAHVSGATFLFYLVNSLLIIRDTG